MKIIDDKASGLPKIIPFEFENQNIRAIIDGDGEPWWFAQDVAAILGYSATGAMNKRLDENEARTQSFLHGTTYKKQLLINESGLYSAIFGSQLESAKKFKKWVTSEVLPSIRKTGQYGLDPKTVTRTDMAHMILAAEAELQAARDTISELAPKAEIHNMISETKGLVSISTAIKTAGGRPVLDQRKLYEAKLLYRDSDGKAMPYQRFCEQGLFEVKARPIGDKTYLQTMVTPKGIQRIASVLNQAGV